MSRIFFGEVLITVLQWVFCGPSLPALVATLGRIVFLMRIVGAVVNFKISVGIEIAGVALLAVWLVFTKSVIDWKEVLLFVLFSGMSVLLQLADDRMYLYITEDDRDEK
jgi:hypothetical protein